jgi:hypothetical protein
LQAGKFWQAVKQSSFVKMFSSMCEIFPLQLPAIVFILFIFIGIQGQERERVDEIQNNPMPTFATGIPGH